MYAIIMYTSAQESTWRYYDMKVYYGLRYLTKEFDSAIKVSYNNTVNMIW